MPQNSINNYLLVVYDYFSYENGPIDLVRGSFSSLNIKGSFMGAQMPQNSINTHFLAVLEHFSYKNGPIDLVRGRAL
jgi:hypothetical protein